MAIAIDWFEIPVKDVGRAVEFYGTVMAEPLGVMDGPDGPMHIFPGEEGPNGALTTDDSTPAEGGVLIYLGCADIDAALARVSAAGGAVLQEKTSIGPFGFIGRFKDTEGNTIALHTGS